MARKYTITKEQLRKMRKAALREKYKSEGLLDLWMRQSQTIGKNKRASDSKTACRKKVDPDDQD
ncbi:hypothetical protein LCGC14_0547030 [marine sediment metagenome]|uniref:Uncharacterized protein n=1 Tax=marine sediment metagenome TaxID=412755 RepID=A0A0F9UCC0_9ZZZZ